MSAGVWVSYMEEKKRGGDLVAPPEGVRPRVRVRMQVQVQVRGRVVRLYAVRVRVRVRVERPLLLGLGRPPSQQFIQRVQHSFQHLFAGVCASDGARWGSAREVCVRER